MWRAFSRRRSSVRRGFSLMEATVSLALLVLVMVVALTLLFQMKAFAERQQMVTMPRQAARRAVDYLTFNVTGAADLNYVRAVQGLTPGVNNPNALISWYGTNEADPTQLKQGCYNDVASATLADLGTDILTLSVSESPVKVGVVMSGAKHAAGGHSVNFFGGCPDDAENMRLFKQLTGAHTVGLGDQSGVLTLFDGNGNWQYFQITDYGTSACAGAGGFIAGVKSDTSTAEFLGTAPNGELPLSPPITLAGGVRYVSFRVRNGNLEQKLGIFDAANDAPGTNFVPIVENIVDLQVAYIYPDGSVWNTSTNSLLGAGAAQGIPPQSGPCQGATAVVGCNGSAAAFDPAHEARNVIGLRVSLVARSPRLSVASQSLASGAGVRALGNHIRPALEDHAAGTAPTVGQPLYEYYRLTTTLMFRNRILGS